MKNVVSEDDMNRIIDASFDTMLRTLVAEAVGIRFKSVHYLSSRRIVDAVVLNLALNDKITPSSADEIITTLRRSDKSLYTTVESAFLPIKDKFDMYAQTVLGDNYIEIEKMYMRAINYIVYVISLDLSRDKRINGREVITRAYTYAELIDDKIPHY
ncbi:MAG: hypothetical protein J1F33_00480 [Clostridiales bacterium]|nr:hypothetical protein [Clostridiales bacterium]